MTPEDFAFYEKVSPVINGKKELIPPPTLCPDCRLQRQLSFRNERKLYRRTCDLTGKPIISIFAPDGQTTVYRQEEWWSDRWDPFSYGREIDFSRPFFEQYSSLLRTVPFPHIHMESCENTEYGNLCWGSKNGYLIFGSDKCEDCSYSYLLNECRDCVDCAFCKNCERCYELLDSERCHRCTFSQGLVHCDEVHCSLNCKSCQNCIGCAGLNQKRFHLFNQPLSEGEYRSKVSTLLSSRDAIADARQRALALDRPLPHLAARLLQCEHCTGDDLSSCKNCTDCFDGKGGQDCVRAQNMPSKAADCHDIFAAGYGAELCYDCLGVTSLNTCFSFLIYPSGSNILYSALCGSCDFLFGCAGLRRKQYCILNKQYTKEEYERLVPKIIERMRSDGEWGEFFHTTLSPFAYNETAAHERFPLTKEGIEQRGWRWKEVKDEMPKVSRTIAASQLLENIDDVSEDILNCVVTCKATRRPYKIIKQELDFYRTMHLPLPHFHPEERHRRRMALRNPRKLWKRNCAKCEADIQTTYAPERPESIYCEKCYLKEVY
jgi:hypothetical protein